MKDDFVTIEIAKKLKEKRYTGKTDGKHVEKIPGTEREEWDDAEMMYVTVTNVVTYPRAHIFDVLKWLREEKDIHVCIDIYQYGWYYDININIGQTNRDFFEYDLVCSETEYFHTYEEAALAGIEYTLDHLI